jgi:hypothetical protein
MPFSGAPFSKSVAPIPLRYGVGKYDYDKSFEDSDNAITSNLYPLAPLLVCTSLKLLVLLLLIIPLNLLIQILLTLFLSLLFLL